MWSASGGLVMSEQRLTMYLVGLGLLAALLIMTAYLAEASSGQSVNKNAWVKQNELVLTSLPVYPGAVADPASHSVGEPDPNAMSPSGGSGRFRSYWTSYTYRLPAGASTDVVLGFYSEQLLGWDQVTLQGAGCQVAYRRERVALSVAACNATLELDVNYRSYDG